MDTLTTRSWRLRIATGKHHVFSPGNLFILLVLSLILSLGFTTKVFGQASQSGPCSASPDSFAASYAGSASKPLPIGTISAILESNSNQCLQFLWVKDVPLLTRVFTELNIIEVANSLAENTQLSDVIESEQLLNKIQFLRIAYYHRYYIDEINFKRETVHHALTQGIASFFSNLLSSQGIREKPKLISEMLKLIDASDYLSMQYLNEIGEILGYYAGKLALIDDLEHTRVLTSLAVLMQRGTQLRGFSNAVSAFVLDRIMHILQHSPSHANQQSVHNNLIWALAKMHADRSITEQRKNQLAKYMVEIFEGAERFSESFIWSLKGLSLDSPCFTQSNGEQVCIDEIKKELENSLFKNEYLFSSENNDVIFRTNLKRSQVALLWKSLLQVEKQFFAKTGVANTANNNDANPAIIKIHPSQDSYKRFQSFLFSTSGSNGGIYIEQDLTLYTFDRRPTESRYSLDELLRHEYVHFLIGRYLVPGQWGTTEIYKQGRLTWIDEGLAEFFAGSHDHGVALRPSLVGQINKASPSQRLSLDDLALAQYSEGFSFYSFAGAFFGFLDQKQSILFDELMWALKTGTANAFDAWENSVLSSQAMRRGYEDFLESLTVDIQSFINSLPSEEQTCARATQENHRLLSILGEFLDPNLQCEYKNPRRVSYNQNFYFSADLLCEATGINQLARTALLSTLQDNHFRSFDYDYGQGQVYLKGTTSSSLCL